MVMANNDWFQIVDDSRAVYLVEKVDMPVAWVAGIRDIAEWGGSTLHFVLLMCAWSHL